MKKEPCPYCSGEIENKSLVKVEGVYCDEIDIDIYVSTKAPRLVVMQSDWIDSFSKQINYCPMCGRKLEV
jgi:hypothetical protein